MNDCLLEDGFEIMRSIRKVSVMSSLLVLLISAIFLCFSNAGGIGDSTGKSVDQLIDESNGIFSGSGHPQNPSEARSLWNQEHGIEFGSLNNSEKSAETGSAGSSRATISSQGVSYQTDQTTSLSSEANTIGTEDTEGTTYTAGITGTTGTESIPEGSVTAKSENSSGSISSPVDMAGNWSFRLRDSKTRVMALVLYQSEDAVFGTGIINDGGETMKISASGRIEDERLSLDATSLGTVILYRMALTTNGRSASGDYRAFSNNEPAWMGTVEGTRI